MKSIKLEVVKSETPAQEICRLHGEITEHARTSLEKAIRLGELLTAQKSKVRHGEWLPWVENNLPFDRTTATRYMQLFDNRAALAEKLKCCTVHHLTGALKLIADSKPRKVGGAKPEKAAAHVKDNPEQPKAASVFNASPVAMSGDGRAPLTRQHIARLLSEWWAANSHNGFHHDTAKAFAAYVGDYCS